MLFQQVILATLSLAVAAKNAPKDPTITTTVVFSMEQDGKPIGDISIGLFGKTVPKTV
jgi:hypothetical protein